MILELKNLVVHLDAHTASEKRMNLAIDLAARHGARLTGLFSVVDRRASAGDDMEVARSAFLAKAEAAGVNGRWVSGLSVSDREVADTVRAWAAASDMAIIGQENVANRSGDLPRDLPEYVILNAGRPILVVPFADNHETLGERILVAFNGGRESTRALNDAIPFLKRAKETRVALVNSKNLREGEHGFTENDVVDHLSCHGIGVILERLDVENVSVMDMLLSRVAEEGKDMLVMGAYGHMSFPRLLRGSATRHILEHMTVPTLMSH